ncbi:sensor histidine kinase [Gryllotalpicola kribbensis]|uniref:sensor histidine kinase n=1 Tax=Gryllotalpicola kribbensis TaxID=993084 RepID=UPI0031D32F80
MPAGRDERSRRSALRVWVPVVLSALVQLGTTFAVLATRSVRSAPPWVQHHAPQIEQPAAVIIAAVLLALAGPVLLIWIRRRPGPVLVAVAAVAVLGESLLIAVVGAVAFYVSVIFGVVIAVLHGARLWAWVVTGVLWLTPIALYLVTLQPGALLLLVPWTILSILVLVVPEGVRNRRAWRAQLLRDAEARRAEEAQAERVRIARELHDVLAHSLSQINVQASVGLHLFDSQPDKAAAALASVKETSKQALGEVRQVLGMLRGDAPLAPERGLADIPALVDGVRAQGIDASLRFDVAADVQVSAATQQAAFRIAQEALTNVTRHAAATRVHVAVTEEGGTLRVSVADDGRGAAASASADGRGLIGMRERAELLGGSFVAGPAEDAGFRVEARLPIEASP